MLRRLKTGLLILLVLNSMFMSYLLWHGNWQNSSGVSLSNTSTFPVAAHPTALEASAPYEIVFHNSAIGAYSIVIPQSKLYNQWLGKLTDMQVFNLHPIDTDPAKAAYLSVQFNFGTNLSSQLLTRFIPALRPTIFVKQSSTFTLFQTTDNKPVMVSFQTSSGVYVGTTDLNLTTFNSEVTEALQASTWAKAQMGVASLVPQNGIDVIRSKWDVSAVSLVPLVRSFFVNQEALTRIQEPNHTIIWTDGSRVVWLDKTGKQLTYNDPNTTEVQNTGNDSLLAALQYIRDHGGTPANTMVVDTAVGSSGLSYVLRPYVNGYPIVDGTYDYTVTVDQSKIVQYRMPQATLGKEVSQSMVHTVGRQQLANVIKHLKMLYPTQSADVQIGYVVQQETGATTEQLEPVFAVSQNGYLVAMIDAVSGQVIKGMGNQ